MEVRPWYAIRLRWRKWASVPVLTDREFLPAADEISSTPPSPVRIAMLLAICALFAVALIGSWFGRLDIYAVASGRIQPMGRSKVIQPITAGRVLAIFVKNGAKVRAGDILVKLDSTEASAEQRALAQQVAVLQAEIARRKAALLAAQAGQFQPVPSIAFPVGIDGDIQARERAVLAADLSQLQSAVALSRLKILEDQEKISALTATIASHGQLIETLSARVKIRKDLEAQGWESQSSVLDAVEDLEKELAVKTSEQGQLAPLNAEIATLKQQVADTIAHFIAENSQALADAAAKCDQSMQDLVKASARLRYTRLAAPISGTVQEIDVTTIGQVVSAGQQLMTIVPAHASLEITALIENQDIGFIRLGQSVVIKIDAFPFTRYGTITGRVSDISRDAVDLREAQAASDTQQKPISPQASAASSTPGTQNLVFPVTVALDSESIVVDGNRTRLSPGMSATVEIQTGDRRVIDYVLSPLREDTSGAAHER